MKRAKLIFTTAFLIINCQLSIITCTAQVKLLGMTLSDGVSYEGVIFQFEPSINTYTKKVDLITGTGANPKGSLMQATDGQLYGMTEIGGTGGAGFDGTIFQYNASTNTYTKKIDLSLANGCSPSGSLMQASDGKLYGMTPKGGANYKGVIFQYDPSTNTYTKKIDLSSADGYNPEGALVQASDGKLYGMTPKGGTNDLGVIFQYDPSANTYTKKIDLSNSTSSGYNPYGSLIQATDGKLYGMTFAGGANDKGIIFQYDPSANTFTKKIDLISTNGCNPYGSLIQATDGKLYGMTTYGGTGVSQFGTIFQYDPVTNIYTKKIDLHMTAGNTGNNPKGSLMQASDGKLYGMTSAGGMLGSGVIFQYDPTTNTYTENYNFVGSDNSGSSPEYTNLIEYNATIGVNELVTKTQFSVYPNPFTSQTTIAFSEEQKNTTIKIMDVLGKEIKTIILNGAKSWILEKGEMQEGIYFVQLINENNNVVNSKIIVQ